MKLEVGKTYVLNNGEKHVCEFGTAGPFAMGFRWYKEDGRCGPHASYHPYSVSHEYTQPKGKTLAELDLKPGDVVEFVDNSGLHHNYMVGKQYTADSDGRIANEWGSTSHSIYSIFRIVSRTTPQPTLWRDMTDAQQIELYRAKDKGIAIQDYTSYGKWVVMDSHTFHDARAYRIKPTPKVETVTMYGNKALKGFGLVRGPKTTHRITFNTIDGKPDPASIKMDEL